MSEERKNSEVFYVIKDLITNEVLIDDINRLDIQAALDQALTQQKAKGIRQDRPSFYLSNK